MPVDVSQLKDESEPSDYLMTIDSREPKDLVSVARKFFKGEVKMDKLDIGDFRVEDGARELVRFERKKIADFAQSLQKKRKTGRFKNRPRLLAQISELSQCYPSYLAIVGTISDLEDIYDEIGVQMRKKMLYGAMASCLVRFNVPVLWVENDNDCVRLVSSIASKIKEGKLLSDYCEVPKRDVKPRHVLRTVTSHRNARRLERDIGSVQNVVNATRGELQKVKGIGPTTAERIKNKLCNED